ncbi:hypothetical protein N658DRAFT_562101 [Parathielavia hyrcaniae]|uniref:Uncharacterized protein n=1 Tax=Parathielavia hyrcaniae TaxID=113614 RepID=A0AAN6PTY3_9PEZI|nr:hypothetical protein N658DRAFT_562101 [Parathielavia hyrcaniae]
MSATALVNQAPTYLGPLTTTFTPPAECTVAVGVGGAKGGLLAGLLGGGQNDAAWLGQACTGGKAVDDISCWPETSKGAESKTGPFHGWGFYSPGLHCPVGYATACSATGGSGGQSGWPVQFKLGHGETAVGCCPSGYGCANINGQTCTMVATSTVMSTVTCDGNKRAALAFQTIPDPKASITAFSLFAPMIQINWQSSDRPSLTSSDSTSIGSSSQSSSAPSTTTSDRITASGTPTVDADAKSSADTLILDTNPQTTGANEVDLGDATPTPTPSLQESETPSDSGSFSSGAKVAIGVTGAVAVVMMVVCVFFYCWRRRKTQREEQELDRLYGVKGAMTSGGDFTHGGDIPGWYRGQRLMTPTKDPFVARHQRDGSWATEVEPPPVLRMPTVPHYRPYRPPPG